MRGAARVGVCATVLLAGATGASAAGESPTPPTLRLLGSTPLLVQGKDFRPSEKISVTAHTLLGPRKLVVRASGTGTFRASIRLYTQPCGKAFAVRAVGDRGSVAMLRLRSEPCVPPPRD